MFRGLTANACGRSGESGVLARIHECLIAKTSFEIGSFSRMMSPNFVRTSQGLWFVIHELPRKGGHVSDEILLLLLRHGLE
jgi:hypothetical protein